MHELALDRARERLAEAKADRPRDADVAALLERAHRQLSELSQVAAGIEAELPGQVAAAVRNGVRSEAGPVGRQLAEVRGLAVQIARRLDRLEADLTAERYARVEDLGLLVELISAGWAGVDERLARIEQSLGTAGATVHRLGDRRADPGPIDGAPVDAAPIDAAPIDG
jgi:hypothetical protein